MRKLILFFPAIFLLLVLFALSDCTTTRGTLYSKIATSETKPTKEKAVQEEKNTTKESIKKITDSEQKGLKIITHPDNADIYINDRYMGKSPLLISNLEPGNYKITIEKEGYYTKVVWINYEGNPIIYETDLKEILGFLSISVTPSNSTIIVGNQLITEGLTQLPIGIYQLTVKSFGYREYKKQIRITPETVLQLNVKLERAEFNVSEISTNKKSFNPKNPGLLGEIEISFEVTSWGEGNIEIYDESNNLVFTKALKPFVTWDQSFNWNGRSNKGDILPDGLYRIVLTAKSSGPSKKTIKREKYIKINSSLVISFRNFWNGSSGLLYAETTDILPPFDFQISMLSIGHSETINGINYLRFPSILSLRFGLGSNFEIGASGALIFENSDTTPYNFNLSLKKLFFKKRLSIFNLSLAGTLRITYQGETKTDIFSNPGGVSFAIPLSLSTGILYLLYSPEVVFSYYRVTYPYITGVTTNSPLESWAYQRLGTLLDLGFLTGGFSISLRSAPFSCLSTNDFKIIDPPFQVALELNFMIPKTRTFFSLLGAAEIENLNNYYVSAGVGLSYLY